MKRSLLARVRAILDAQRERSRLARLPELMAQDLEIIASALRAGSSLIQAIQVAANEGEGAMMDEWVLFLKDVRLGASLDAALRELQVRAPIPPIRSFATAVSITQSSGGNLAGVLLSLAGSLRQEITFQGKLSAMTAQGRLSGYIVSAMPFFLMIALYIISPELMRPFFHSGIGQMMLVLVVILIAIGSWLIKKIVTIEV